MNLDDTTKHLGRGWDDADRIAAQGGMWIKLDPGQSVTFNVVGDPEVFEKEFKEAGGETRVSTRFSVDVWVPGHGLRTWEMGKRTFSDLKRQKIRRGDEFPNALFLLERIGSGMQTKYALDYDRQLRDAEKDERNAALLKTGSNPDALPF